MWKSIFDFGNERHMVVYTDEGVPKGWHIFDLYCLEGKRYKNKSQSHVFLRSLKIALLLPTCSALRIERELSKPGKKRVLENFSNIFWALAAEKSPRSSHSVKNRGFEICSNIFLPLIFNYHLENLSKKETTMQCNSLKCLIMKRSCYCSILNAYFSTPKLLFS